MISAIRSTGSRRAGPTSLVGGGIATSGIIVAVECCPETRFVREIVGINFHYRVAKAIVDSDIDQSTQSYSSLVEAGEQRKESTTSGQHCPLSWWEERGKRSMWGEIELNSSSKTRLTIQACSLVIGGTSGAQGQEPRIKTASLLLLEGGANDPHKSELRPIHKIRGSPHSIHCLIAAILELNVFPFYSKATQYVC
jgi:hypothetical protein